MPPIRITVCGFAELAEECEAGPSHELSLLDPDVLAPPELSSFAENQRLELRFHDIIEEQPSMCPPEPEHIHQLLALGRDVLTRAADVMLKEGRKLVLCVRDTPFNRVHLENMLRAQQAGAVIMPAAPAFYHHPKTIDELVMQYVCRVLSQAGLPQEKMFCWTGSAAAKKAES